jgi:peptidoglycan/LPS O-acetylase OafA/YrhL
MTDLNKLSEKDQQLPQLNGIRTIAVSLVILFHWFPQDHWLNTFPNGTIGVTLFFVLSGYLITGILLNNKSSDRSDFLFTYKNFMIRRALRIFPIYYLTLSLMWILPYINITIPSDFYSKPFYYLFYVYNHLLEKTGNWSDILSPFWTLAVEEQFYVFWAIFMLLLPKKSIKPFLLLTIILGVVFRYYFDYLQGGRGLITITCIDCFAIGGFLSLYKSSYMPKSVKLILQILTVLSLIFILFVTFYPENKNTDFLNILFLRSAISCISAYLILILTSKTQHWFTRLLSLPPVSFLGKISYGIYVYHMLIPALFWILVSKLRLPIQHNLVISLVVLLTFCYLSWVLIEKPFNSLKSRFKYKKRSE